MLVIKTCNSSLTARLPFMLTVGREMPPSAVFLTFPQEKGEERSRMVEEGE